jgi:hypothetical protein
MLLLKTYFTMLPFGFHPVDLLLLLSHLPKERRNVLRHHLDGIDWRLVTSWSVDPSGRNLVLGTWSSNICDHLLVVNVERLMKRVFGPWWR